MAQFALGSVAPTALVASRLELHYASQIVAAAGTSLLEAVADYSHTALRFDAASGCMRGAELAGGLRAALNVSELRLELVGADASFDLAGHSLAEGTAWLEAELARATDADVSLTRPEHDLPEHALSADAPFAFEEPAAFAELSRYFAAADGALAGVAKDPAASPVRLWPHHFDLATLITLDAEAGTSVGVGFSPGDGGYAEPYYYVTPWPYPKDAPTAALASGGKWHLEGWTGAVLTATAWLEGDAEGQPARLSAFLESAISASRALVSGGTA
ncbi:MAG: hypothetical protein GXP55_15630 [Deltaproteobacteria bacterium]|nr:hypothetical protein [Deltaproteobacteria bacterium]